MTLEMKYWPEYSIIAGTPQVIILGLTLFLLCINVSDYVNSNTVVYADDTTFSSKCNQASDEWQGF